MALKVSMTSLGCCKNLVDAERMLYTLRSAGYQLVTEPGLADVAIINTCGFIQSAKEEAIETILEVITLKNEGRLKSVIVTGCLSERYNQEAAELFPEADAVIGIGDNLNIASIVERTLRGERVVSFPPKNELPLTGKRIISTLPFFAYLKVAEGCDNCCSYCAIPQIRGRFRSVPMEDAVAEAQQLAENGVTELIVVAQDTTRYGEDLYGKPMLAELLSRLAKIEGLRRIRTLYCYPERITDELLEVMAKEKKIVRYLDIPIQHCNGRLLELMNRKGSREELSALFAKIRAIMPDVTLRTTIITGFPTETDEDFTELCEFVKAVRFDRLGCFAYSEEENTPAERLEQLPEELRSHRADILMQQQSLISEEKNAEMLGKTVTVVIEGYDRWSECFFGRSDADAPDIDGKIFLTSEEKLSIGQYVDAEIIDTLEYDLIGRVLPSQESRKDDIS